MEKDSRHLAHLDRALACLFALALLVDLPSAQAYNEHVAWTEVLGRYVFHGVKELSGLPVPFTPFELLSYGLLISLFLLQGLSRERIQGVLLASVLVLPVLAALALGLGLFRGHALELALTQLHFLPMIAVWLLLGAYVGQRPRLQGRMIRIVFWASLWRAGYAWYVYLIIYGGSLGQREFLIDHASSMILALGLCYGAFQAFAQAAERKRLIFYLMSCLWIVGPYILNERRASFAGLVVAFLLMPWVLPPLLRQRIFPLYRWSVILGSVFLAGLAVRSDDVHSFAGGIRAEALQGEALSYRHIENYDLLLGLIEEPFTGLGFGRDFPQVLPLPDISFTYPLYTAIPHNQVYFLWAFAGPLGIAGLMTLSSVLWVLVVRCGRLALRRGELLVALMGLVALSQWLLFVFFDMGLLESRMMMLVGIYAGALFPSYARSLGDHYEARKSQGLAARDDVWPKRLCHTHSRSRL